MEREGTTFKIKEITRARCHIERVTKEIIDEHYLALKPDLVQLLIECSSLDFTLYVLLQDELIEYIRPEEFSKELIIQVNKALHVQQNSLSVLIRSADERKFFHLIDTIRRERIALLATENHDMNPKILDVIAGICSITPKLVKSGVNQRVAEQVTMMAGGVVESMTHDAVILRTLVKMIKTNVNLYDHSATVAILSGIIAHTVLRLPDNQITAIIEAGLYHDIGKTALPNHIQLKNGKHDPEEQEVLRTHTILGYEELNKAISKGAKIDRLVAKVALEHHERIEGQGYPRGLKGRAEEDKSIGIHLYSRVIMIADVFATVIVERLHHAGYSVEESIKILAATADEEFDPQIIHPFLKQILLSFYEPDKVRQIYPFRKNNGLFYAA